MVKEIKEVVEGRVIETLPNLRYRVSLKDEREVIVYTSGKMRHNTIRVIVGDRVLLELDPRGGKDTNRLTRRL